MEVLHRPSNTGTIPSRNGNRKRNKVVSAKRAKLQARLEPLKNRFASNAVRTQNTEEAHDSWLTNPNLKDSKTKLRQLNHTPSGSRSKSKGKSVARKQEYLYKNVDSIMSKMLEGLVMERPADKRKWIVSYLAGIKGPAFVQKYEAALELQRKVQSLRSDKDQLKDQMRSSLRRHHGQMKTVSSRIGELQEDNDLLKETLRLKLRQLYSLKRKGGLGGLVKEVTDLQAKNKVLRSTLKEKITLHYKRTRGVEDIPALKEENADLKRAFKLKLRKQMVLMSQDTEQMVEYQKNLVLRKEFSQKAATNYHLLLSGKKESLPKRLRSKVQVVRSNSQDGKSKELSAENQMLKAQLAERMGAAGNVQLEEQLTERAGAENEQLKALLAHRVGDLNKEQDALAENKRLKAEFAQKVGNPSISLSDILEDNVSLKQILEWKLNELDQKKKNRKPKRSARSPRSPRSPREDIEAYKQFVASGQIYEIKNIISG